MKDMSKSKKDIYQQVTDRIVLGLQTKGLQWFKPWNGGDGMMSPINNLTGKPYKGVNTLFLCIEQMEQATKRLEDALAVRHCELAEAREGLAAAVDVQMSVTKKADGLQKQVEELELELLQLATYLLLLISF